MPRSGITFTSVLIVGALVFAAAASVAAAQDAAPSVSEEKSRKTSTITFYGHVFGSGLGEPMPANTQFPTGEDNYGLGAWDWCTPAASFAGLPPTNAQPSVDCDSNPNNKLAFYSTAGFVQVSSGSEFDGGGGYSQLHNERGSTKDIVLDPNGKISATVYLSQDVHGWSVNSGETYCLHPQPRDYPCVYPYWGWDPGFAPNFVVKATLYMAVLGEYGGNASDQPPIADAIRSGSATVIAEGETAPQQVINGLPGYENVYAYTVDLGAPTTTVIPKEANFFVVFSVYNVAPDGSKYGLHTTRWWSGEFFPPSFTLPVKNAFDVESVVPQFVHGKLAILGIINTPWGSYDVDPTATKLTVKRDNGDPVSPVRIETLADYSVAHGAHYKPVNVTFIWDYAAELPAGRYEVTLSAANNQRSASAACTAYFTIGDGGAPGSTEPGLCGIQTGEEDKAAVGDASAPPAAGGGADSTPSSTVLPALPVVGVAGLALLRRRGWS